MTVRLMAPFSMKCTSCGEFIYKGRKFNARKETTDEKYLAIPIYRFYIRCTRCSSEITFKTDPKNMDFACEKGAKRNFESWRDPSSKELQETDEERLDRLEKEEAALAEEEERNAMEELEQKMEESKREMQIADALDEIRTRNARIERGERTGKEEQALAQVKDLAVEERERQELEIEAAARRAFQKENADQARLDEHIEIGARAKRESDSMPPPPPPSFERVKKVRKPLIPGLVKKAETPAVPSKSAIAVTKPAALGLDDYGSDDE